MTCQLTWFVTSLLMTSLQVRPLDAEASVPDSIVQQIDRTKPDIKRIAEHILHGPAKHEAFNRLARLGDKFGHRMVGSDALEKAIDYIVANMTAEGFDKVAKESITAPKWIRGKERARLVTPRNKDLAILGLGSSVGTNGTALQAQAIVVRSFDELKALRNADVAGKIVVYNQGWLGHYYYSVPYRTAGASEASKKGAIAALISSVTDLSINSPHTGQQNYADGVDKIPAACITVEDAEMLQRMYDRGDNVTVELMMEAENQGDITTSIIVAEITGSEFPNETVIVGGHVDTWDVGDGSMDDGGGLMISWQALSVLKQLNLRPKRTMRVVLWNAEEQGLIGARQYYDAHKDEVDTVSLIMESDHGAFKPRGIGFSGNRSAYAIMKRIMSQLVHYNASDVVFGAGRSSDTKDWLAAGVPGVELESANEKYFYFHHSHGDTMTVLNADDLDLCTLVWVTASYVVANLDQLLPRHDVPTPGVAAATSAHCLPPLLSAVFVTSLVAWFSRRL